MTAEQLTPNKRSRPIIGRSTVAMSSVIGTRKVDLADLLYHYPIAEAVRHYADLVALMCSSKSIAHGISSTLVCSEDYRAGSLRLSNALCKHGSSNTRFRGCWCCGITICEVYALPSSHVPLCDRLIDNVGVFHRPKAHKPTLGSCPRIHIHTDMGDLHRT